MAVISKPVKMSFIVSKEKTQEFLSQKNNGGFKRSLETFKRYQKKHEK